LIGPSRAALPYGHWKTIPLRFYPLENRHDAVEPQPSHADTILSLLAEKPDRTLSEYQAGLAETGHRFRVSTIWRFSRVGGSRALAPARIWRGCAAQYQGPAL
jgi:hypothetical protein